MTGKMCVITLEEWQKSGGIRVVPEDAGSFSVLVHAHTGFTEGGGVVHV